MQNVEGKKMHAYFMCVFHLCVEKLRCVPLQRSGDLFFPSFCIVKIFFQRRRYFFIPFYLINLYNFMFWEKRQCDDKNLTKYLFKCNLFKLRRNYIHKKKTMISGSSHILFIILIHVMKNNWISFKMIIL